MVSKSKKWFNCFSGLFGSLTSSVVLLTWVPAAVSAQEDLVINYEFFRIDDALRPLLVYKIKSESKVDSILDIRKGMLFDESDVFDCDHNPVQVESNKLVATDERCEDKVGGPLTFKIIKAGQTLDLIDSKNSTVGTATWKGDGFQIASEVDPELVAKIVDAIKEISASEGIDFRYDLTEPNGVDVQAKMIKLDEGWVDYKKFKKDDVAVSVAELIEAMK